MKLNLKREGRQFFLKRMSHHYAQGKTIQESVALAKKDGETEYGADWAMIMEFLMTILPILLAIFKK